MTDSILCPSCGAKVDVAEAVEKKVRADMAKEFVTKSAEYEEELARQKQEVSVARRQVAAVEEQARQDTDAAVSKARAAASQEILNLQEKYDKEKRDSSADTEAMLAKRMAEVKKAAEVSAREAISAEVSAAKEELEAKDKKLADAQARELDLRKKQRELEDARRELELETARRVDEERSKILEETTSRMSDEYALNKAEWEKQRSDLAKQLEDMRRKAEQGSQQSQGETLELAIEEALRDAFRLDTVEPVAKGVRGGDSLLRVSTGITIVGSILFEMKRTKNWSDQWPGKLKDDMRAAKADMACIVTQVLPPGVRHVGFVDGVWVCDVASAIGFAGILRHGLIEAAQARAAATGKADKMTIIYDYLSGPEFRGRIESVVESFSAMAENLAAERRSTEKNWAMREKLIAKALQSAAGLHGDLGGLMGSALQKVELLEMKQ